MIFSSEIIKWYSQNKRDLPWRKTTDPYKIWLSEIILQQTRVNQGLSYYLTFLNEFPNIHQLALAKEDKVLKLWQGLGYYSRARNLHYTAKYIVDYFDGEFPKNYSDLLLLRGIGTYTAAAISSFSFGLPHAVVDGNVIRVISRVFGIKTPFDTGKGRKEFAITSQKLLPKDNSAVYNQAIMDFGSIQCKPHTPNCLICCMQHICVAFKNNNVRSFPVRLKKNKIKKRYLHYLMIEENQKVLIKKRNTGIWQGLYEFPYIEFSKSLTDLEFINSDSLKQLFIKKKFKICSSFSFKHRLSHQIINVTFWYIRSKEIKIKGFKKILLKNISKYPVSRLMEKYLNTINKN